MKMTAKEREQNKLAKQEQLFLLKGLSKDPGRLNSLLAEKVPDKLKETLEVAFAKAFSLIFEQGTGIIEKTYKKDAIAHQYQVNSYSVSLKEDHKTLGSFSKSSRAGSTKNLLFSGVSGAGLGTLGIGIPDIPIFVSVLLKSIYEIALHYGFSYDSTEEKYFILLLIKTPLSCGKDLKCSDEDVNRFIKDESLPENYDSTEQIKKTASALSTELLCMKFLQGIPIVGAVGGIYNTVYLQKIQKYARMKYYRRFLEKKDT